MKNPGFLCASLIAAMLVSMKAFATTDLPAWNQPPSGPTQAASASPAEGANAPTVNASFNSMHPPVYPRQALADGIEGKVELAVVVATDGVPIAICINGSSGNLSLDEAAIAAARAWRFYQKRENGVAVVGMVLVPVTFTLFDDSKVRTRSSRPEWADAIGYADVARLAALKQAADHGDLNAASVFDRIQALHIALPNPANAVPWYAKAAARGDAGGEFDLATAYDRGEGIAKDHARAREWFEKVAKQGDPLAEYRIGRYYEDGDGVSQDFAQAARHYQASAARGNPYGQAALGLAYMKGMGVAHDDVLAYAWLSLASRRESNKDVGELLAILEKSLSREGLAEARGLSSSWRLGQTLERAAGSGLPMH